MCLRLAGGYTGKTTNFLSHSVNRHHASALNGDFRPQG
jgi:hypothetical protein